MYGRRLATLEKVVQLVTDNLPREQVVVALGDASVAHNSCISRR